jgi:hypothetical protein
MIRVKSGLRRPLLFVVVALFFNSCLKEEETIPIVYGDVLIETIQRSDSVLYGLHYYAYSYNKMDEVTVRRDDDDTVVALDSVAGRYTFSHVPALSEYKNVKPVRGEYIFDVFFSSGQQQEVYDVLDSTCILPVRIKTFDYDGDGNKLVVEWEGNSLDDQYYLVLVNEDNEVVFQSGALNVKPDYLWIYSSSNGWATNKEPQGGEKYKAIITAYQYETVATAFDLQSISAAESGYIEWNMDND